MWRYLLCIALTIPLGVVACGGRDLDALPRGGGTCTAAGVDDPYATSQEAQSMIVGRWGYCSGAKLAVGDAVDTVKGIEILADGRYFMLVTSTGGLVRGQGFDYEGTWGPPHGGPYYQIDFTFPAGNQLITSVAFRKQPRRVRFEHTAGTVDYALIP